VSSDSVQSEEFLELANGCLCCSIKDTGVAAIEKLMQRKGAFDHILLETTGLADPGECNPFIPKIWLLMLLQALSRQYFGRTRSTLTDLEETSFSTELFVLLMLSTARRWGPSFRSLTVS
jgi:hypothetical protein